jgi:hypothetical protein
MVVVDEGAKTDSARHDDDGLEMCRRTIDEQ